MSKIYEHLTKSKNGEYICNCGKTHKSRSTILKHRKAPRDELKERVEKPIKRETAQEFGSFTYSDDEIQKEIDKYLEENPVSIKGEFPCYCGITHKTKKSVNIHFLEYGDNPYISGDNGLKPLSESTPEEIEKFRIRMKIETGRDLPDYSKQPDKDLAEAHANKMEKARQLSQKNRDEKKAKAVQKLIDIQVKESEKPQQEVETLLNKEGYVTKEDRNKLLKKLLMSHLHNDEDMVNIVMKTQKDKVHIVALKDPEPGEDPFTLETDINWKAKEFSTLPDVGIETWKKTITERNPGIIYHKDGSPAVPDANKILKPKVIQDISLLKERENMSEEETKETKEVKEPVKEALTLFECGSCGKQFRNESEPEFCPKCGTALEA